MAEPSEQTIKAITIDPHGDVKLVLDDGTLLVSRATLCRNSSVFRAMFDEKHNSWEASDHAIGGNHLRNIPLPEDDFDAMEIVMRVMHQCNDMVPTTVEFDQLHDIAEVCDKYDLRETLKPWSLIWSQPYLHFVEQQGYERWLFISMVFRDESVLSRTTKHLMVDADLRSNKLTVASGIDIEEGVPDNIIRQMKEQRASVTEVIQEFVRNFKLKLLHSYNNDFCKNPQELFACNDFNLGYLHRNYPWLSDSYHKADENNSILRLVSQTRDADYYGIDKLLPSSYQRRETDRHAGCGLDKRVYPELKHIIENMQGLTLKPLVLKK